MRVLLLGSSGFIGQSIASSAPDDIHLTGTYKSRESLAKGDEKIQLDFLSNQIDWHKLIDGYDCIIVAARANSTDPKSRTDLSKNASMSFENLLSAINSTSEKKNLIVINGSLSYGDRGDELVKSDSEINPTGFAKSYAIAEAPFRKYHSNGDKVAIIRAPWVLGKGSWYEQMYDSMDHIPVLAKGEQWMSIITLEDLSKYIWDCVENESIGIFHPKLTYRCRQKEFASIVAGITEKKTRDYGFFRLLGWDKQMKESVVASIRLDDERGDVSENLESKSNLIQYLQNIHSDF